MWALSQEWRIVGQRPPLRGVGALWSRWSWLWPVRSPSLCVVRRGVRAGVCAFSDLALRPWPFQKQKEAVKGPGLALRRAHLSHSV